MSRRDRRPFQEVWDRPSPPRILLVDDDELVRRAAARFLGRAGFEVVPVGGGREALAFLATGEEIDLVIVDLEMPEMDGTQVLHAVRAVRATLRVGLWSASPRLDELPEEDLRAATFVRAKLGPLEELVDTICEALAPLGGVASDGEPTERGQRRWPGHEVSPGVRQSPRPRRISEG